MTVRLASLPLVVLALPLAACGGSSGEVARPDPAGPAATGAPAGVPPGEPLPPAGAQRPALTSEECAARGGSVVGDIGDGATHRPDYVCASGAAPIGNVQLGVEGSVCCPGGPAQGTSAPAP